MTTFLAYWVSELSRTQFQQEEYAVYSAYLTQEMLQNSYDFGDGKGLLIILDHSLKEGFLLKPEMPGVSARMRRGFWLRNLRSVGFSRKFALPVEYKLVTTYTANAMTGEPIELSEEEQHRALGGYTTFSRISFDSTGRLALFYAQHLACGLCSGASMVLMQKQSGQWKIIDEYSPWVS